MSKIDPLAPIGNISGAPVAAENSLNSNFQEIEESFQNTLSRNGSVPNEMQTNLDMNSFRVVNAHDAVLPQDAMTLMQAEDILARFAVHGLLGGQGINIEGAFVNLDLTGGTNIRVDYDVPAAGEVSVSLAYPQTVDEAAASVTPTFTQYLPGNVKRYGALGDGVADDAPAVRMAIASTPTGGTVHFPRGTYLLSQDGANVWCVQFTKPVSVTSEPGAILKAATNGVRCITRFEAPVIGQTPLVLDGDFKAVMGVEIKPAGDGSRLKFWESKNYAQTFINTFGASCFRIESCVNTVFENCYAHDAIGTPNAIIGDNPGTARGFMFEGASPPTPGTNIVRNCRIDNIRNTNGLAGNFEDEDGIVTQIANGRLLAEGNVITNCMKRGIKCQGPATVVNNVIVSSRTLGSGAGSLDDVKGMYSGVSVYYDDCYVMNNVIVSMSIFDGTTGGSFAYGVEVGTTTTATLNRATVVGNIIKLGPGTNARQRELLSFKGALIDAHVSRNRVEVDTGLTLSNTYGIRFDNENTTTRAIMTIEDNNFVFLTVGIIIRGGFSGTICGNKFRNILNPNSGIYLSTHAYTLSPKMVLIAENQAYGFTTQYGIRIDDLNTSGLMFGGNTSDSTTHQPVFVSAGIRYVEGNSQGFNRPSVEYGTAPPTTGTYSVGDIRWAMFPGFSAPVSMWRCRSAGTPGTWTRSESLVSAGATGSRPTLTTNDAGVMYLDTTLHANGKPIFWTGFLWVDATGVSV